MDDVYKEVIRCKTNFKTLKMLFMKTAVLVVNNNLISVALIEKMLNEIDNNTVIVIATPDAINSIEKPIRDRINAAIDSVENKTIPVVHVPKGERGVIPTNYKPKHKKDS
jgi:hypothetical protein